MCSVVVAGSSSKSSSARSTPAQVSPASYKPSNKEKHKHKHKAEKEKGKGKEAEPKDQEPAEPQAEEITNVPVGEFKVQYSVLPSHFKYWYSFGLH